jgi:hypothetical protein
LRSSRSYSSPSSATHSPASFFFETQTLDSAGNVGAYTSVTVGADGLGLISYYDVTNGDLKVAHCANALCVNYLRRR